MIVVDVVTSKDQLASSVVCELDDHLPSLLILCEAAACEGQELELALGTPRGVHSTLTRLVMVFRYIKKVSTVVSLVITIGILWSIYFLTFPRPSSINKVHGRFRVDESHSPHKDIIPHPLKQHPVLLLNHQSTPPLISSRDPHHVDGNLSKQHSVSYSMPQSTHLIQSLLSSKDLNFSKGDLFNRIKPHCSDSICSDFFTDSDKPHFKYCVRKTWGVTIKEYQEPTKSTCVFINGTNRYPLGLASYPGSGNTWVRGLLQKITGLCIGGVYCDVELRKNGYPGESIRSGIAFMVKSHQVDPRWNWVKYSSDQPFTYFQESSHVPIFSGGVFILRNPFHAMVAEYKRQVWEQQPGNHVKTLNSSFFGECAWLEIMNS